MGPMLVLVLAIVSCVGYSVYQLGETNRFNIVPDTKGGVYVLDRKSASIHYCTEQSCKLIGNGSLPSQAVGNPAMLAAMQQSIMGAPAVVTPQQLAQTPAGMQANIATTGAAKPSATDAATTPQKAEGELAIEEETPEEISPEPDGFNFN